MAYLRVVTNARGDEIVHHVFGDFLIIGTSENLITTIVIIQFNKLSDSLGDIGLTLKLAEFDLNTSVTPRDHTSNDKPILRGITRGVDRLHRI